MVKNVIFLILLLLACSSCMKTSLLKDGTTKVPINEKLFYNPKFSDEVFKFIDTNSIYVESFTMYRGSKELPKYFISILRFYPNGLYSSFTVKNDNLQLFDFDNLNLDFRQTGHRGYYYFENDHLELVSFGPVNELYTVVSVKSKLFKIEDNLMKEVYYSNKASSIYYERNELPAKWKHLKPNKKWE